MSKGETKIVDILNRERVRFEREKTFSDLKRGRFRFDFLIHLHCTDCIVEFNGEQHYEYVGKFYKNQVEWRQAQGRDMRKISYCLAHNIPLYIIPYWEIDNIHCVADLLSPKYLAQDRYKNFTDYEVYQRNVRK